MMGAVFPKSENVRSTGACLIVRTAAGGEPFCPTAEKK